MGGSNSFPESGVRLVADASDYTDTMNEALSLAAEFDALGDMSVSLDASVDTSQAEADLSGLTEESGTVEVTADVTETEDTKGILESVRWLATLETLETVWNVVGTGVDIFKNIAAFAVEPMLDLDDAVAKVNAQTGGAIPNARELISGIFYDDLGDSIDQVGKLVIQAQQIGAPLDEATRAALTFTHTFQEEDPSAVLNTMDQMVKNGLAPDFKTAGDNLTVAFQNGANRGGDLLTTINDNAGAIRDLGLTGPQAMEVFTSGMDAGFKSSQDVLNTLIKIKQNVQAAAGNPTSDASKTLDMLGIANPAETGDSWSLDFFQSVIDGIKNAPVSDTDKQTMFSNLLGSKVGAKEFSNLMRLSPEDWANVFSNVDGAAETAATTVDDSLRGALDDFSLAATAAMEDFLSSDAIDLPGKIAALKTGLQDGLDELASGGTLGEALTVALKPIGFDDEFRGLESALQQFIIALLQAVASIQELTGHGDQATTTRGTISGIAGEKLKLDLEANTSGSFTKNITDALANGIKPEDLAAAVKNSVQDMIKEGNTEQAQAIIDLVQGAGTPTGTALQTLLDRSGEGLGGRSTTGGANAMLSDLAQSQTTQALDDLASAATDLTPTVRDAEQADVDRKDALDELKTVTTDSTISLDAMTTTTDELAGAAGDASALTSDVATSMSSLIAQEQALEAQLSAGSISLDEFNTSLSNLIAIAQSGGGASTNAEAGGGAVVDTSGAHAAGTDNATGTFMTGEDGREIVTTNRPLAVLNNRSTEAIMSALSGFVPGASKGGGGTKNITLNQYNIVPNKAVGDSLGYETGRQIRSQT